MKIEDIMEVTIVDTHPTPLRDTDTVKLFHGTSNLDFIITAVKKGFSGDTYADRIYSYEYNNNPRGLFVTPDFKTAKYFGQYVIEFHARVSDLESPVWPNGSFTVQGGMSGIFSSEQERELERLRNREEYSNSDIEYIRNSDRPELAAIFLSGGERQALFVGSVNEKSIKAIWVPEDIKTDSRYQTLIRKTPKEFLKLLKHGIDSGYGVVHDVDEKSSVYDKSSGKLVKPREDISIEEFIERLNNKYKSLDRSELVDILKRNPSIIDDKVWSISQATKLKKELL